MKLMIGEYVTGDKVHAIEPNRHGEPIEIGACDDRHQAHNGLRHLHVGTADEITCHWCSLILRKREEEVGH